VEPYVDGYEGEARITISYRKQVDSSDGGSGDLGEFSTKVPTDVGTYDVKAVIAGTPSVNEKTLTGTFKISPRTAELSWKDLSFIYDGEEHIPTAEVANLIAGDKCEVTVEGTGKKKGDYTAKATGLSNANYELPEVTEQKFTISKDTPKPVVTMTGWTYAGKADAPIEGHAPLLEGVKENAEVTYTYAKKGSEEFRSYAEVVGGKAGSYTVKAVVAGTDNYEAAESVCDFTIEPLTVVLKWSDTKVIYDKKSHVPTADIVNIVGEDSVSAKVDVEGEAVNAGEYIASIDMLQGTDAANYKLPEINTQTFVIAKAEVTLTWGELEFIYNGSDQCPTVTVGGLAEGDTEKVQAKVTGAATAVGTHAAEVVKLTGEAAANYELPEKTDVTFGGKTNLLDFKEYEEPSKLKEMVSKLEDIGLVKRIDTKDKEVKVYIGEETEFDPDTTIIKTNYEADGNEGTIAIIGPKRMEYDKVVTLLNFLKEYIEK
jgi:hypothetical protein